MSVLYYPWTLSIIDPSSLGPSCPWWSIDVQPFELYCEEWYHRDVQLPRVQVVPLLPTRIAYALYSSSISHSVTQGYFGVPCAYLAASGGNPAGFDSGLLSGKQYSLDITNDQERTQTNCYFISLVVKRLHAQPSFSSARPRVTVVSEWLGKCYFSNRYIQLFWMTCVDGTSRSAINALTTGNTYAAYLAGVKALGSNEPVVSCSFVPLGFPCTYYLLHDFQISNTGAMTGGVGATPVASPAAS